MASKEEQKPPEPTPETAPDPDEDDLDELDDMLDEFSATKISNNNNAASTSAPAQPQSQPQTSQAAATATSSSDQANVPAQASEQDGLNPDEFERQMREGMAEMLREFESNPDMAKQFEEMMKGLGAPPPPGGEAEGNESGAQAPPQQAQDQPQSQQQQQPPEAFTDAIKRTMDRMQASSDSASAKSKTAGGPGGAGGSTTGNQEDDFMAALLKEMQSGGGGAGGEGASDDAFSSMLMGMMEQLTNRDILYEPMLDLHKKFPEYLAEREPGKPKASELKDEDRERYLQQQTLVKEIVERFEKPGYSDQNSADREFIVERMQKMQAAGAPPEELVGDMAGAEQMLGGMGGMGDGDGCAPQ